MFVSSIVSLFVSPIFVGQSTNMGIYITLIKKMNLTESHQHDFSFMLVLPLCIYLSI